MQLFLLSGLHTHREFCFTSLSPPLSPFLSPVLSSLLRVVQQDSDNVEEAAQHFESKVKHSHPQTCNAWEEEVNIIDTFIYDNEWQ